MSRRSVLLGAGGHAKVLLDALRCAGEVLPEVALDEGKVGQVWGGVPVKGGDELLPELVADGVTHFLVGLAGMGTSGVRRRLWEKASGAGLTALGVIHPRAVVSVEARLGEGVQILAGAVVNADAVVGRGVIVNTGAIVEHDVEVGEFCHLAPRSCLAGGVRIGEGSHVGLGAVVREYRRIGAGSLVGAGAVVVGDWPESSRLVGVPARERQSL